MFIFAIKLKKSDVHEDSLEVQQENPQSNSSDLIAQEGLDRKRELSLGHPWELASGNKSNAVYYHELF